MVLKTLKNKKIVISAAASGIGWEITKTCVSKGASVFLCDIDKKLLNKIKNHKLYNKNIFISYVDASNENDVITFFRLIKKKFDYIDCLINNVGIAGPTGLIEKLDSKEWEKTLLLNVVSHFYFTKQAIPLMKKSKEGSIINLSSTAGILGFPRRSPYAASKWAIIGLTKTVAMELGKFNIRVNAICPGSVSGPRMDNVIDAMAKSTKINKKIIRKNLESMTSIKGFVSKSDIANMCIFLMGKESKNITGQVFPVDGNTERMS